ncbi:hypothetical protein SNEBB_009070 [Seison nebaliae]|nr:hypothetical protein SNEBB_009070 [Seison nebaliae]
MRKQEAIEQQMEESRSARRRCRRRVAEVCNQFSDMYSYDESKLLGKGAAGSVYECESNVTPGTFAVKVIEKCATNIKKADVVREVEVYFKVRNCKFMLFFYDYFEAPDKYYLVFERMTGGNLSSQLFNCFHRYALIRRIIIELLSGLSYLHSIGIAHRDVKPDNVLCGELIVPVKLGDFGLSSSVQTDDDDELILTPELTSPVGTPEYMCPEISSIFLERRDVENYTKSCDVWSLGVIFYMLLFNRQMFMVNCGRDDCTWNEVDGDCSTCLTLLMRSIIEDHIDFIPDEELCPTNEAIDLCKQMLQRDHLQRISANNGLKHKYISMEMEDEDLRQLELEEQLMNEKGINPSICTSIATTATIGSSSSNTISSKNSSNSSSDSNNITDNSFYSECESYLSNDSACHHNNQEKEENLMGNCTDNVHKILKELIHDKINDNFQLTKNIDINDMSLVSESSTNTIIPEQQQQQHYIPVQTLLNHIPLPPREVYANEQIVPTQQIEDNHQLFYILPNDQSDSNSDGKVDEKKDANDFSYGHFSSSFDVEELKRRLTRLHDDQQQQQQQYHHYYEESVGPISPTTNINRTPSDEDEGIDDDHHLHTDHIENDLLRRVAVLPTSNTIQISASYPSHHPDHHDEDEYDYSRLFGDSVLMNQYLDTAMDSHEKLS